MLRSDRSLLPQQLTPAPKAVEETVGYLQIADKIPTSIEPNGKVCIVSVFAQTNVIKIGQTRHYPLLGQFSQLYQSTLATITPINGSMVAGKIKIINGKSRR